MYPRATTAHSDFIKRHGSRISDFDPALIKPLPSSL
jgi:hypothetical protein